MSGADMFHSSARLRQDGRDPSSRERRATPKNDPAEDAPSRSLIRWSLKEIRRIATRLARKRIHAEHVIAWLL
jgi:hypothetical protein